MDLEEIKRKRLEKLKQQLEQEQNNESQNEAQLQQQINQLWEIARNYLTKEAISRYSNIKVAHPEIATKLLVSIVQAIQQGYITEKINDERLKEILREIQSHKKDFRIIRK